MNSNIAMRTGWKRLESRRAFCAFAGLLLLVKLWSMQGLPIWALPLAPHDDAMMVNIAHQIGNGGPEYDQLTLVKGWSFPLFLAVIHKLRLPYLLSMALLHAGVSLMAAAALSDGRMKPFYYALYAALLFNPAMTSRDILLRVYRNGLSALTAFAVIVALIAIYLRRYRRPASWLPWTIAACVALPVFYYTREDSIWLLPFLFGVAAVSSLSAWLSGKKRRAAGLLAACMLPVLALGGTSVGLRAQRQAKYGVGITNELSEGEFPRVMKAIYAVKTDEEEPLYVAASRAKIRMLYAYSPSLRSIESELEAKLDEWSQYARLPENRQKREVENGWFFWCLRDAAQQAGHFASLEDSQAFWKRMADELESALDGGQLERRWTMPSALMPPWTEGTGERLMQALARIPDFVSSFEEIPAELEFSMGRLNKSVNRFEAITGNIAICDYGDSFYEAAVKAIETQNRIAELYQRVWPVLSAAGRLCAAALLLLLVCTRNSSDSLRQSVWILAGVAGALLVLYGGVAYNHAESCNSIITLYLSAAYPLVILFDMLAIREAALHIGAKLLARGTERKKT